RQDRLGPLLWSLDAPDLLEDSSPHGPADDFRRPDGRFHLRAPDRGRRRDGRRRFWPGQPPDFLLLNDPDAAVLRGRRDPLFPWDPDLHDLLPSGETLRKLGGVKKDPETGIRKQVDESLKRSSPKRRHQQGEKPR